MSYLFFLSLLVTTELFSCLDCNGILTNQCWTFPTTAKNMTTQNEASSPILIKYKHCYLYQTSLMWREFLFGRFLTIVCNTICLWFENFYVQIIAFSLHHCCLLVLVFISFPCWMFWWNNNSYFNNSHIRYLK